MVCTDAGCAETHSADEPALKRQHGILVGKAHPPSGSLSRAETGALDALLRTTVLARRFQRTAAA
jgi:hypothetical protein